MSDRVAGLALLAGACFLAIGALVLPVRLISLGVRLTIFCIYALAGVVCVAMAIGMLIASG